MGEYSSVLAKVHPTTLHSQEKIWLLKHGPFLLNRVDSTYDWKRNFQSTQVKTKGGTKSETKMGPKSAFLVFGAEKKAAI
jgi:hypothetical protein